MVGPHQTKMCGLLSPHPIFVLIWFGLMLYVLVNSYGHVGTVSVDNHTFFLGKLDQAVNQNFEHILSPVTDKPSWGVWPKKWFHDQSPQKFGTGPGWNSRSLDLQSGNFCAEKCNKIYKAEVMTSFSAIRYPFDSIYTHPLFTFYSPIYTVAWIKL